MPKESINFVLVKRGETLFAIFDETVILETDANDFDPIEYNDLSKAVLISKELTKRYYDDSLDGTDSDELISDIKKLEKLEDGF